MQNKITKTDIAIVVAVFCFTAVVSLLFLRRTEGSYVKVVSPEGTYMYPLSKNFVYTFKGIMGESKIEVNDGYVFFTESPCPNKNCISDGKISKTGSFNACLPNGISVTIVDNKVMNGKRDKVDAVSI